jgi:transcriptional antiterminator NusG
MLMRHDVTTAKEIDLTRCYKASDRQQAVSRRTMALLAAAGMDRPARRWFVLAIAGGQDKAAKAALLDAGVEVWMPTVAVMPARKGRSRQLVGKARAPVFKLALKGYLFAKVEPTVDAWAGLATAPGFVGMLGSGGQPLAIRDDAVALFRGYLADDPDAVATVTNAIAKGDSVTVKDGPLRDFPGLVASVDDARGRAIVDVMIFGHVNPVHLDLAQIRKT